MFDIKALYRSIKETLLKNAIEFAQKHTGINKNYSELMCHA